MSPLWRSWLLVFILSQGYRKSLALNIQEEKLLVVSRFPLNISHDQLHEYPPALSKIESKTSQDIFDKHTSQSLLTGSLFNHQEKLDNFSKQLQQKLINDLSRNDITTLVKLSQDPINFILDASVDYNGMFTRAYYFIIYIITVNKIVLIDYVNYISMFLLNKLLL